MRTLTEAQLEAIQARIKASGKTATRTIRQTTPNERAAEIAAVSQASGRKRGKAAVRCPAKSEHQEQVEVMRWWAVFAAAHKLDERLLFAIPNGGARHPLVGKRLKAEGVRAGVPDLFLAIPTARFPGMWIELKAQGRKVEAGSDQAGMIELLRRQGFNVVAAIGAGETIYAIERYLGG